jgi:hypothetical protein
VEYYAAHTMMAFQRVDGVGPLSVFENIYLVRAANPEKAMERAKQLSESETQANDGVEINGVPANCVYGGVRKLITICNEDPPGNETPPDDGSEISYISYEVGSLEEVEMLASGHSCDIHLID